MQTDWNKLERHIDALREAGCAVMVITPDDIQAAATDEDGEPTLSDEAVLEWLSAHRRDVEEALLGEYWGETIRDLLDDFPATATPQEA